jgi:hypothetical protein
MTLSSLIPPEPKPIISLDDLAPRFGRVIPFICLDMAELGWSCRIRETARTDARQQWLYGFGRLYDDGRGIVTGAKTARNGWHFYKLAADLVSTVHGDNAPRSFYLALERVAGDYNCRTGLRFTNIPGGDGKHVQWGPCRISPSWRATALYTTGGLVAVWKAVGAY